MVITNETLELGNSMWFWDQTGNVSRNLYEIMFDVNNLKTNDDGRKFCGLANTRKQAIYA